ncbi:MAG: type II toxin-antitoxin system VapC family toxin [Xanthomonadales bacterium]|nr:type II toxin-antitoxin system VapC family toxin [Xanthomonadales bacterium]MBK7146270.1 type II toxin-antitoxin system VapC family toxin [Xanthomonadales bacterium]MCC6562458.1 type II toxin-antitoxin system VapC family toxin [Xanthomonadales bacterium]
MRFLLDTNICIYIQRHKPAEVLARFRKLRQGEAGISAITHGELLFGAMKSRQRERVLAEIAELILWVPALVLPEGASLHYATLRAEAEAAGKPIGGNDLWIAAHALASELTLVTNNEREFKRVPGLRVQNWVNPS